MEPNSVEVIKQEEDTIIRIVENGEKSDRNFQHSEFANSWAAGQRVRLKVPTGSDEPN